MRTAGPSPSDPSASESAPAPERVLTEPAPTLASALTLASGRAASAGSQHAPAAFSPAPARPITTRGPAWLVVGAVAAGSLVLLAVVAGFALGSGTVVPPQAAMTTAEAAPANVGFNRADESRGLPSPSAVPGRPTAAHESTRTDTPENRSLRSPAVSAPDLTDPAALGRSPERALGALGVLLAATINSPDRAADPLAALHEAGLPADSARIDANFAHPSAEGALEVHGAEPVPWLALLTPQTARSNPPRYRLALLASPFAALGLDAAAARSTSVCWQCLDLNDDRHTDVTAIVRVGRHDRLVVWAGPDFRVVRPLPDSERPVAVAPSRDAGFRLEFRTAADDPALQPGDPARLRATFRIRMDGDPSDTGLPVTAEYAFEPPGFARCHLALDVGPPQSAAQWLAAVKLLDQLGREQEADDLRAAGRLLDRHGFASIRGASDLTYDQFRAALGG